MSYFGGRKREFEEMAAAMNDIEQGDTSRYRGDGGAYLSVSRSSRIVKAMRRPKATQRPPATVFQIRPEGFRNLVQQLTGASEERQQQPVHPSAATADAARSTNMRLQMIAPLPLRPILPSPAAGHILPLPSSRFSHPHFPQLAYDHQALPSPSALSQMLSPDPPLLAPIPISPRPPLTPNGILFSTFGESPGSSYKQLAQLLMDTDTPKWDQMAGGGLMPSPSPQFLHQPRHHINSFLFANQTSVASGPFMANGGLMATPSYSALLDGSLDQSFPGSEFVSNLR